MTPKHYKSADLSRCVLNFLPGRFTFLKWFPLGVDRTYFVSLDKKGHSNINTLYTLTLRGRAQGTLDLRSTKQVLFAPPDSKMGSQTHSLDKTSTSSARKCFGMLSEAAPSKCTGNRSHSHVCVLQLARDARIFINVSPYDRRRCDMQKRNSISPSALNCA